MSSSSSRGLCSPFALFSGGVLAGVSSMDSDKAATSASIAAFSSFSSGERNDQKGSLRK